MPRHRRETPTPCHRPSPVAPCPGAPPRRNTPPRGLRQKSGNTSRNPASRSRSSPTPPPAPTHPRSAPASPDRPAPASASQRPAPPGQARPRTPPAARDAPGCHATPPGTPRRHHRKRPQRPGPWGRSNTRSSHVSCEEVVHLGALGFKRFADLGKGRGFKLTHPLLGQPQLVAEALQRPRIFPKLAFAHDEAFAFVELVHRHHQPLAQLRKVEIFLDPFIRLRGFILERINPFAPFILGRLRRVERVIRPGQTALHHLDIMQRNTDLLRDQTPHLVAFKRPPLGGCLALKPGLNAAHVEEQRLLRRRGSSPDN